MSERSSYENSNRKSSEKDNMVQKQELNFFPNPQFFLNKTEFNDQIISEAKSAKTLKSYDALNETRWVLNSETIETNQPKLIRIMTN